MEKEAVIHAFRSGPEDPEKVRPIIATGGVALLQGGGCPTSVYSTTTHNKRKPRQY